jgi:hypothetical protein
MRKTGLFAVVAALILAGIGGWATSNTQARVATATVGGIDPFLIMTNAKDLPAEHYRDFSMVFR